METSMRKIIWLGIAITLTVVAAGTWAAATTRSPIAVGFSGDRINTLELMSSSKNLPVQQYDAH
jgi:hypothetical protein